jgi:hypothetical protein
VDFRKEAAVKNVEIVAIILACTLAAIGDGWYCWHVIYGPIQPALATWLIFAVASTLSLLSYLKHNDGRQPFIANVANRVDPILVWAVVLLIMVAPKSDKSIHPFDIGCLALSVVIGLLWWVAGKMKISPKASTIAANLLVNLIMVAGYLPTIYKLIATKRNTESFLTWGFNLLVGILFVVSPIRRRDWLSVAYIGRAIICMVLIIGTMVYLDHAWLFGWFHMLR